MLGHHPAIDLPQASEYAKEVRKHEALYTKWGAPGRPYTFQEFPKMLYKAERNDAGRIVIAERMVVRDETEERNLQSRGFHFGQAAALEAIEREQREHGEHAAAREYDIQHGRLSDKAIREVRAAEEQHGARHLAVVPETPIKKRRRTAKVAPVQE